MEEEKNWNTEEENNNANRDGERFSRPQRRNDGYSSYNKEQKPYNNDRPSRPYNAYNRDGNSRPYSKDRPSRPYGDRPSRPYNNERSYNDKPYNNDRPNRSYNNDRPSFNNDRPSYNNDRPSRPYNSYNRDGGSRPYNNRYGENNSSEGRQHNNNENRYGGYNRNYNSGNSYSENRERKPWQNNGERNYERPERNYGAKNDGEYNSQSSENEGEQKTRRPRIRISTSRNDSQSASNFPRSNNQPFQRPYNNNRGGYDNNRGGYDPNAKYSQKKQFKYREEKFDPNEPIRLNKYLANAGLCSRREADEFIQAGVVTVNDEIVTELGTKVKREDKVMFHNQPVNIEKKVYILLNKPKDCVTTTDDPQARMTVMQLVHNACKERIYPVGRLDRNTTGVLLLTNDGELASKLTHPKFIKKKIYQVTLDKNVTEEDMEKIADGIELEDGEIHADAISYASEDQKDSIGIEIHSGRNRIVRRIFEKLGYKVYKLDRVYFAGLTKKGLSRGKFRFLNDREVNMLRMGAFE